MFTSKGSYGYGEPKNVIAVSVQKTHSSLRARKYYQGWFIAVFGREWKFAEIGGYLSPRYRVCTKAMFISKGSCAYGEPKNVIAVSVQKTHSSSRASKQPGFVYRRMCSRMEIWENWGLPISKVPCLHQGNVYIKRKLRVWGV